jgi:polar amino acid transport system substrate-binding protein
MTFRRLALAALLAAAGTARAGEGFTIVSDTFCPYTCEPGGAAPGYLVEAAQKIFAAKGVTVTYEVVAWDAAIEAVRAGKHGAIIGAFKKDTPDFVFPAATMGASRFTFLVRKGDAWRYAGVPSLKGKKLGLTKDYTYGDAIEAFLKANPGTDVRVEGTDPLDLNVKNLLTKRVDVVVEESNVVLFKSGQRRLGDLVEKAGESENAEEMYLAFSPALPRSKEWSRLFSEGLDAMRKSGELGALLKKYGVKDWK